MTRRTCLACAFRKLYAPQTPVPIAAPAAPVLRAAQIVRLRVARMLTVAIFNDHDTRRQSSDQHHGK
ncbi:Uncharacterised protein [Mycobacteroides abscessus subsp. abscessus]|nr:Uncharacterised protein [Mycobacteroides abscessus]SHS55567.1 Uncharacterised protein [Mycobacteroides abscessus subsp. abscessus]CQA05523.1 Uncharacterised protein [Mycobacteroides abscessus]SHV15220.1 Uncharacterised protein [Mycobacteroides abscessus subsp. abscessus]SHV72248.1 Uncharacterised protein [Mycobacteroides abscessus subsp. abscessus]